MVGATLLDIGGGIGAIQHELAKNGVREIESMLRSRGLHPKAAQETVIWRVAVYAR